MATLPGGLRDTDLARWVVTVAYLIALGGFALTAGWATQTWIGWGIVALGFGVPCLGVWGMYMEQRHDVTIRGEHRGAAAGHLYDDDE